MSFQNMRFNHGDEVLVHDYADKYRCRGRIVGRAATLSGHRYDVLPSNGFSLSRTVRDIPEERLVLASGTTKEMVRAYSGPVLVEPKHIKDEA